MAGEIPAGRVVAIRSAQGGATTARGMRLDPGRLTIGLVLEDVPLADLVPGTRLEVGSDVVLELVSGADADRERVAGGGLSELGEEGLRSGARVLTPGTVRVGDRVAIAAVPVPIGDALDLHPFRPEETVEVVREYVARARAAGLGEVRLIHGRGRGVQREAVRRVLRTLADVAGFGDASPERGGWGATIVRLRPPETPPA